MHLWKNNGSFSFAQQIPAILKSLLIITKHSQPQKFNFQMKSLQFFCPVHPSCLTALYCSLEKVFICLRCLQNHRKQTSNKKWRLLLTQFLLHPWHSFCNDRQLSFLPHCQQSPTWQGNWKNRTFFKNSSLHSKFWAFRILDWLSIIWRNREKSLRAQSKKGTRERLRTTSINLIWITWKPQKNGFPT